MEIRNCAYTDIEAIDSLYQAARELQTQRKMVVWPSFEGSLIENEINESRQWKLIIDGEIACNWAITFEDKEIWEDKDKGNSIFIHRICTNPQFRGNKFIHIIVEWAKAYAIQMGKEYVRLDTLGNNTKLIQYYTSAGFKFLGIFKLADTSALPKHYQDEPDCCLFEIKLDDESK